MTAGLPMNVAEDVIMLAREDWLPQAQSLCIGSSTRVFHRREGRPNLVIHNRPGEWAAYCHACRDGGVVPKEHVKLVQASPEARHSILTKPTDMLPQAQWPEAISNMIATFLASKGMDLLMLPPMWYSCTRKRLLIQTAEGIMGRDITGNALDKWLTYDNQHCLTHSVGSSTVVVVEDTFSFFKVIWACPAIDVVCALGTSTKDAMVEFLIGHKLVLYVFDGDAAGYRGAMDGIKRLKGWGTRAYMRCAPNGFDPKDLSARDLQDLIYEGIQNVYAS